MIENVTYQGQLGRSCHPHLEDFLLPKPSKKIANWLHFSSWLFINSQLQNVQFLHRSNHSKFSHWKKSTNVVDGENYTWTDSSSRNNIWSSFSSTDLNIKLIWISKCGLLSFFFKCLIKWSPGHKIPQLEELYSGLGVHWSIILLKTNLSSSLRLRFKTNPYRGPVLVSASCCWSSMNKFNLLHTACTWTSNFTKMMVMLIMLIRKTYQEEKF